jgi:outer membrane scaffolding protein for murein synthesis (MipA/OmpV family)
VPRDSIAGRARAPRAPAAALAVSIALLSGAARADVSEPPASYLQVGPGVYVQPAYPGANFRRSFFLPDIEAQYHNWLYVSATDLLGVYVYNHAGTQLGAALEWDFTERRASDSPAFAKLGDVPTTPRLKVFARTRIAMFSGGVNVATDVGGHGEGTLAQAHVELLLPLTSHGFLSIGPGVIWSDSKYMAVFYGVTAEQSTLSGLPQFDAGSGVSQVYAELFADYQISSRWSLALDAVVGHLEHGAAHSPFTSQLRQSTILASLLYRIR